MPYFSIFKPYFLQMLNVIKRKIEARLFSGDVKRMIDKGRIPDHEASMKRLKGQGFTPDLIFDIGAYHGDFSQMCLNIWPESRIIAFEALPEKAELLKSRFKGKSVQTIEGIVGDEVRENVEFFADETSSSVLASQELTPKKKIRQKMFTLDELCIKNNLNAPDLLKIDSQGYEYQILKGFEKNLKSVKVILLELNFIEVYYHVNLAHEVIKFLADNGFVIYDICEIHRRPLDMALFQIDFMFVKQHSQLRSDKRWDKD
jgi:FkbM family methyltransferase